jgi:hypothetical protein
LDLGSFHASASCQAVALLSLLLWWPSAASTIYLEEHGFFSKTVKLREGILLLHVHLLMLASMQRRVTSYDVAIYNAFVTSEPVH